MSASCVQSTLHCEAVSDTHSEHSSIPLSASNGSADVLICAGDWSSSPLELAEWMSKFPHPHKLVVPGNCDTGSDSATVKSLFRKKGITMLIDDAVVINGVVTFPAKTTN